MFPTTDVTLTRGVVSTDRARITREAEEMRAAGDEQAAAALRAKLPPLPVEVIRLARPTLADAHAVVLGYRDVREQHEGNDAVLGRELSAVMVSALGICLPSVPGAAGRVKLSTLQSAGYDVVRHGELVGTDLWDAGYAQVAEHVAAGRAAFEAINEWLIQHSEATAAAEAGFVGRPTPPAAR